MEARSPVLSRTGPEVRCSPTSEFICEYVGEGGFPESRGTGEENMVKSLASCLGGADEYGYLLLYARLPDKIPKKSGAKIYVRKLVCFRVFGRNRFSCVL